MNILFLLSNYESLMSHNVLIRQLLKQQDLDLDFISVKTLICEPCSLNSERAITSALGFLENLEPGDLDVIFATVEFQELENYKNLPEPRIINRKTSFSWILKEIEKVHKITR